MERPRCLPTPISSSHARRRIFPAGGAPEALTEPGAEQDDQLTPQDENKACVFVSFIGVMCYWAEVRLTIARRTLDR